MRLIDADTFKEYICNAYEQVKHMYPDGGEWARQITEDFCKDIDEQPTIDISNNSNTLGALDCIDRQEAIKALCREECGMDPKGCCVGTCYDVEIIEDVPSVQLELSNNSPELDNKNGELISRQKAIDAISKKQDGVFDQDAEIDTAVLYVYSECKAIIKHLPSILPEGIRCKDCKHWMMGKTTKNYPNPYICELHSFMHGFERSALPEDYCSWAELR